MSFSWQFQIVTRVLTFARVISFIGSAFSEFAIPLFIIQKGEHPVHAALQWTLLALARFSSGYIVPHLSFIKSDRKAVLGLDLLQGLAVLIPVLLYDRSPLVGCYLATLLCALFNTCQQGYLNSFVVSISNIEANNVAARNVLNARIENSRQMGLLVGYGLAYMVCSQIGFRAAFIVDAASFLLSAAALAIIGIGIKSLDAQTYTPPPLVKKSFSLLFKQHIRFLTASQMVGSFALFLFNGLFVFHMKKNLGASDLALTYFFVTQYIGYVAGATLAEKITLPRSSHILIRAGYAVLYLGFGLSDTTLQFTIINVVLSFFLGLSQPFVMGLFQSGVTASDQRAMGAARTALVSIAGAPGAMLAGILSIHTGFSAIFYLGSAAWLLASYLFWVDYRRA